MRGLSIRSAGWYDVIPRGEPIADADRNWTKAFLAREVCLECGTRKPEYADQPVNAILDGAPDNAPLVCLTGKPPMLMRSDLLEVLREFMGPEFRLGTVDDASGRPYPNFVTYTTAVRLPLRGDPSSLIGTCPVCGHIRYYPMPYGKDYIVKDSLSPGLCVYFPSPGSLLVRGDIVPRIPEAIRRKLRIKEIPVKDQAEDGIVDFPVMRG